MKNSKAFIPMLLCLLAVALYGETTIFNLAQFKTIDTIDGEIFWAIPDVDNVKAQQLTILDNGEIVVLQEVDLADTLDVLGDNSYPKILSVNSSLFGSGFILAAGQNLVSWLSNGESSAFNFLYYPRDILGIKRCGEHDVYVFNNWLYGSGQYCGGSVIQQIDLNHGGGGSTVAGGPEICVDRDQLISVVGGALVDSISGLSVATVAINRTNFSSSPYDYEVIYEPAYTKTVAVLVDDNEDVYALQVRPGDFGRYKARLVKYHGINNESMVVCPEFDIFVLYQAFIKRLGDCLYFGGSLGAKKYHCPTGLSTDFSNYDSNSYLGYASYWNDISVGGGGMYIALRRALLIYKPTGSIIIKKEPNEPVRAFSGQKNVGLISVDMYACHEDVCLQALEIRWGSCSNEGLLDNIKIVEDETEIVGVINGNNNVRFENINIVIESGSWKTINFFGDIHQTTVVDSVWLIIDAENVEAVNAASGVVASALLAHGQPLPRSHIIIMPGLNYRMDIFPYRDPTISFSECICNIVDTLYVYPGQIWLYEGVVNPNYYNQSGIVGVDAYLTIESGYFNEMWAGWQIGGLDGNGLLYTDQNHLAWVADDYAGVTSCGLYGASLQAQLEVGEMSTVFLSLNLTKNMFYGSTTEVESHIDNKTIICNAALMGDIDGSGAIESSDPGLGIQQWINQSLFDTQFNPTGNVNLSRQACLFSHPSTANIWAINGYINNPNDPFFSSLGIGQEFQLGQQSPTPNFINNNGLIVVETNDNFVSIFWQNSDGSFHGQDILINGEKGLRWNETQIEPVLFSLERGQIEFQIPPDARVLSVGTRRVSYYPSDIADHTSSPAMAWLGSAYPNPFRGSTNVKFNKIDNSPTTVAIYNIKGQLVRTLINNSKLSPGEHIVAWDGKADSGQIVATGMYFIKIESESYSAMRKMILMK